MRAEGLDDLIEMVDDIAKGATMYSTALRAASPALAEAASRAILQAINDVPIIGPFMAPRTKVETTISGGLITLSVRGMSEGEAGHPPRSDGTVPIVSNDSVNLWNVHEYGRQGDGQSGTQQYVKDSGGVSVVRTATAPGSQGEYTGVVGHTINSLTAQLSTILSAVGAIAASNAAGIIIETASRGKIQVDKRAESALRRAGVDRSALASLGVVKVSVTQSGQINLLGMTQTGATTFISGKSFRVPTTINR